MVYGGIGDRGLEHSTSTLHRFRMSDSGFGSRGFEDPSGRPCRIPRLQESRIDALGGCIPRVGSQPVLRRRYDRIRPLGNREGQ
jgi:hypothetical protein